MACIMNFQTDTSRLRKLFHKYLFSLNQIAGINFSRKENDIHSVVAVVDFQTLCRVRIPCPVAIRRLLSA